MPTYEYRCLKCKKTFDEFQSIKAEALKKCKYCKGKVERIISSGGGFILKGSGFYATDYRKPDYKAKQDKDKPQAACPAEKSKACEGCPKAKE